MLLGIKRMRDKEKWTDYLVSPFFCCTFAFCKELIEEKS